MNTLNTEEKIMEQIPNILNAEEFISARFKEIIALKSLIGESTRTSSIFQRLPKHMRRRAMSHTIKRVPRTLRSVHKIQLERNKSFKKHKRPRRYYRNRPKDILLAYNRRQKLNLWLETHIWHAKRFYMVSKWGYKLAEKSYEKTFKASYRATGSHCLIQDMSYFGCIELSGPLDNLLQGFKLISHSECGLSIGAKCWLSGRREGKITLYHVNSYPFKVIGNVTFMWKPDTENFIRTLWLWSHPAFYQELVEVLTEAFNLKFIEKVTKTDKNNSTNTVESKLSKNPKKLKNRKTELIKISRKHYLSTEIPKYENKQLNIIVSLLKDSLNRFRLIGPLSNAVLTKAFHPAEIFDKILLKFNVKEIKNKYKWWPDYRNHHKDDDFIALKMLEEYSTPSQFSSNVILGGYIVDPRLFIKRKRKKATAKNKTDKYCLVLPSYASENKIWDAEVRDFTILSKITSAKLDKLRNKLLVPGHDDQLIENVKSVIPILFIQRPGSFMNDVKLGYGCGWDIVIPASWGMPVWLSLILCGSKPGALRESKAMQFESKKMPELFPDSQAGSTYYDEIKLQNENKYFRLPPNKRTNYIKYGFPTPFYYPWFTLTEEWCETTSEKSFFVSRNRTALFALKDCIAKIKTNQPTLPTYYWASDDKCLIPVNLTVLNRGSLTPFSHVCVPSKSDLFNHLHNKTFIGPSENIHSDLREKIKRKTLRREHKKELKRLRRKRIKEKIKKIQSYLPVKLTKRKNSPTENIVKNYLKTISELWIPPKFSTIRYHCNREICGFVTCSGFSFIESCTMGQAYVTAQSLYQLLKLWQQFKCDPLILTRSLNTLDYKFCYVDVIVE